MNWRTLFERIGVILVSAAAGTLVGGFLGSLYYRITPATSVWDGLVLVLGGLAVGTVLGLGTGLYLAFHLEAARRKTLVSLFLFDVAAAALLWVTGFLD